MQIYFSFYQLKRKQKANSKTNSVYQSGALVKIVDDDGNFGVADLCPWPELGDLTLKQEISEKGPLFNRALELANSDLNARRSNINLITATAVNNHILITDYENFKFEKQIGLYKVKGTKNYKSLSDWLHQYQQRYSTIRLDFNSCLTFEEISAFASGLSAVVLAKIEVVEDPFPFDLAKWSLLQKKINLAIDFEKGHWLNKIEKPARQQPTMSPLYLTSSMDHPVGLAHGLHFAQQFPEKSHGFLTLDNYEKSPYSEFFTLAEEKLTYRSDGPGIGFTSLLAKENWIPQINWESTFDSFLFFNPQSETQDVKNLFRIKTEFMKLNPQDHILISSSGSTQSPGDLKIFAFQKSAILQSARRVVQQFQLTSDMPWGCVLPLFHVGGLGILARAHVVRSEVFFCNWTDFNVDFLADNRIQLLSLVPTQLFDLVGRNLRAPNNLKYVFVGGAFLDEKLEQQAIKLGWPVVVTYGMTETASMISKKLESGDFQLFNDVQIFQENQKFFIKTDSTALAQLNFTNGKFLKTIISNQTIEIPDRLQLNSDGTFKLLGRLDDQIKINGELVNLGRLKALLPIDFQNRLEIVPLADERKGFKLALVGEQLSVQQLRQFAVSYNQNVNNFEKIVIMATLEKFPRTALNKIKTTELKTLVEVSGVYEKL